MYIHYISQELTQHLFWWSMTCWNGWRLWWSSLWRRFTRLSNRLLKSLQKNKTNAQHHLQVLVTTSCQYGIQVSSFIHLAVLTLAKVKTHPSILRHLTCLNTSLGLSKDTLSPTLKWQVSLHQRLKVTLNSCAHTHSIHHKYIFFCIAGNCNGTRGSVIFCCAKFCEQRQQVSYSSC